MCGILFTVSSKDQHHNSLESLNLMKHRGPDETKYTYFQFKESQIFLGFNRLAIVDLSGKAGQPMSSETGELMVLFNGEIYNFRELRNELTSYGFNFQTNSDTEVLLKGFQMWGSGIFTKIDGQYACVILELSKDLVWIARDRFGEKPLYYFIQDPDHFIVCSEKKAIFTAQGLKAQLDLDILRYKVENSLLQNQRISIFKGVQEVHPGSILKFSLNGNLLETIQAHNYEREPKEKQINSYMNLMEKFESCLTESIKNRIPKEVPYALSLSGGIDSSLIAAVGNSSKVKNFWNREAITIGFRDNSIQNELDFTSKIAKVLDLNLNICFAEPGDLCRQFRQMHIYSEDIIPGLSMALEWQLMQFAKSLGIKVILSGQGADELFCGYEYYIRFIIRENFKIGSVLESFKEVYNFSQLQRNGESITLQQLNIWLQVLASSRKINKYESYIGTKSSYKSKTILDRMIEIDLENLSLPINLYFGDKNGMGNSIEVRHPYLSKELVSLSQRYNSKYFLRNGFLKPIQREILSKYIPKYIAFKPKKIGFEAPTSFIFSPDISNWILERVTDSNVKKLFSRNINIEKKIIDFKLKNTTYANYLWRIASAVELMDLVENGD